MGGQMYRTVHITLYPAYAEAAYDALIRRGINPRAHWDGPLFEADVPLYHAAIQDGFVVVKCYKNVFDAANYVPPEVTYRYPLDTVARIKTV